MKLNLNNSRIEDILKNFPKKRNVLPETYQKVYEKQYDENRNGKTTMSSVSQKMESWLHRQTAKSTSPLKRTLEIGAGTLNQLKYETSEEYDIIEPFEFLYKNSPELNRVRHIYKDISEIKETRKYDRIISIACFEHILNLPEVVSRTINLLDDNGMLCVAIPNEGRFLWKLGYRCTTGIEFNRKYGLNYDVIMKYEHVNNADEIEKILKYYFKDIRVRLFGINNTLALYRYYECKNGYKEKAKEYLKDINN